MGAGPTWRGRSSGVSWIFPPPPSRAISRGSAYCRAWLSRPPPASEGAGFLSPSSSQPAGNIESPTINANISTRPICCSRASEVDERAISPDKKTARVQSVTIEGVVDSAGLQPGPLGDRPGRRRRHGMDRVVGQSTTTRPGRAVRGQAKTQNLPLDDQPTKATTPSPDERNTCRLSPWHLFLTRCRPSQPFRPLSWSCSPQQCRSTAVSDSIREGQLVLQRTWMVSLQRKKQAFRFWKSLGSWCVC